MKSFVVLVSIFLVASVAGAQTPSTVVEPKALFELSVVDVPAENGKRLNMSLREIERQPDYSLVEVEFKSGGSVSSSMFVVRGMCGLAKARDEKFLQVKEISRGPTRYHVTFPKTPADEELKGPKKSVFSSDECALISVIEQMRLADIAK